MAPPVAPRLYTIGTWRVGLDAYLRQLKRLAVRRLVDVRGNPQAGRQEELKRSKAFERALADVGVTYEYWGRELGEGAVEAGSVAATLNELLAVARRETVCLLGHLHEPSGCHRLQLCNSLASTGLHIEHLLWKDHQDVRQLPHQEVAEEAAEVLRFFNEHKSNAEAAREARGPVTGPSKPSRLKTVAWERFSVEMFSDGNAYRIMMPFDTEMLWYPHWLTPAEADSLQSKVREEVTFYHPTYVFQQPEGGFAKTLIKRGQARVCDKVCPGSVSSTPLQPWSEQLLRQVEDAAGAAFNCFVGNHYADGRVVINWHSDSGPGDDEGLGPNPTIGSLSLGVPRSFSLKSKRPGPGGRILHLDVPLTHGSLLVMGRNSQTHWLHALPIDDSVRGERINLTFRFYARQSTRHIEGVEHNHEWETAAGSQRVLLHRDALGCGRPVHVDVPLDVTVQQLPRYLGPVLPHWRRGPVDVLTRGAEGAWGAPLASSAQAAHPELRLLPRARSGGAGAGASATSTGGADACGTESRWRRAGESSWKPRAEGEDMSARSGKGKGKGRRWGSKGHGRGSQ